MGFWIGGLGQGQMRRLPVLQRRPRIDRRPNEGVSEPYRRPEINQLFSSEGRGRSPLDFERLRGAPEQPGVPGRIRRCHQHQPLGGLRQGLETPEKVLLELAVKISRRGNGESTGQFGRGHSSRQFQERQWIASGFRHDSIPDVDIDPTRSPSREKCAGVLVGETGQHELGQSGQIALFAGHPYGKQHQHRLGKDPPGHEAEHLPGRGIEPLGVIDEAQQWTLPRHFRQQAERRQGHEEAVGRVPRCQAERDVERVPLGFGKTVDCGKHRRAELMEPGERQLHF